MDSGEPCVCRRVLTTSKGVTAREERYRQRFMLTFAQDCGGSCGGKKYGLVKLVMRAPQQAAIILFSSFLLSHRFALRLWLELPGIMRELVDDEEELEASTGSEAAV